MPGHTYRIKQIFKILIWHSHKLYLKSKSNLPCNYPAHALAILDDWLTNKMEKEFIPNANVNHRC